MSSRQKIRKNPRKPQQIAEATWLAIEKAVVAGMGFSEASRAFHVNVHTIIMRSRRDHWPIPSRVEERARLLQASLQRQSEAAQERRNGNDQALEAAAESWAERGEAHRALAFQIATNELKKVAHAPPPVESWRDVDFLDRIGRRSAGLDDSERSQNINIGMQLIEYRLASISLPPDAPHASSNPSPQLLEDSKSTTLVAMTRHTRARNCADVRQIPSRTRKKTRLSPPS